MKRKILFIIFFLIFLIFTYKNFFTGNNRSIKEKIEIDDIISKYRNYSAEIEVKIVSNKTQNLYLIKQEVSNNYSKMSIEEVDKYFNLEIVKENEVIKVTNSILNVEKICENQGKFLNNYLFLNTLIEEIEKNGATIEKNDGKIKVLINLKDNFNTYVKYKELTVDEKTKKPLELIVKDNTQKVVVVIKYNDITI